MATAVKVVNYTAEQTAQLVNGYAVEGRTVEDLANALGKTVKSVVAKLAKEGVYQSKAKEAGKRVMLKSEMLTELAQLVGASEEALESLEKATGSALMKVLAKLKEQKALLVEAEAYFATHRED